MPETVQSGVRAECAGIPRLAAHVIPATIASYRVSHVSKTSAVESCCGVIFCCVQTGREISVRLKLVAGVLAV
jgi:hypothetical protein